MVVVTITLDAVYPFQAMQQLLVHIRIVIMVIDLALRMYMRGTNQLGFGMRLPKSQLRTGNHLITLDIVYLSLMT